MRHEGWRATRNLQIETPRLAPPAHESGNGGDGRGVSMQRAISRAEVPATDGSGVVRGRADGDERDVVDPDLADLGAIDAEVEGDGRRVGLGAELPLDFRPAADRREGQVDPAVGEDLPGVWRVPVLIEPDVAVPFGAGGDQVREPEPHPGPVTHRLLGEAIRLVAGDVG